MAAEACTQFKPVSDPIAIRLNYYYNHRMFVKNTHFFTNTEEHTRWKQRTSRQMVYSYTQETRQNI
ncbi:hypothetical protein HanXRQr2_Chr06g0274861 [Helianthus annuus]|uniref:Uncharacterized protein n=1 Tax=Helianthus annuus TaxID=4232 RepID=A0A9K3IVS2_HELAN|nr:hypothetical protein HanXRQr2_Chr06g0274861 [Helianthus annuus]KAJ0916767.1 hypothetical protein HanPSC8_Chr06g0265641 [Helianthus annuus]